MNYPFINEVFQTARDGINPTLITKMSSGFLLLGFQQFLPGYVVLFADPPVSCLNDLSFEERANFLRDMSIAGDALLRCTEAYRINYEILGNESPVLHAHIFPRYMYEKEEYRKGPVWHYKEEIYNSVMFDQERHKDLIDNIKSEVETLQGKISKQVI